jgi:hypothetical protein
MLCLEINCFAAAEFRSTRRENKLIVYVILDRERPTSWINKIRIIIAEVLLFLSLSEQRNIISNDFSSLSIRNCLTKRQLKTKSKSKNPPLLYLNWRMVFKRGGA